jgi:endonuclease YncB( thermonuclease family)
VVFDARGLNVANVLIQEGLARRYNGRGPRELWC